MVLSAASELNPKAAAGLRDGILVGALTYEATRDAIEYRDAEPIAAKGKSEPVLVWEVFGERERAAGLAAAEVPLIGREAELERLLAFTDETFHQRRASSATVLGSPGIGKSRLLAEVTRRLEADCAVYRGRCLSYGEGITYWPLWEVAQQIGDLDSVLDDELARSRIEAALGEGNLVRA